MVSQPDPVERSRTYGLNTVTRNGKTTVNLFVDGCARDSYKFDHRLTLAEAFIWLGTTMKLEKVNGSNNT